jgi:hypothetical protein
VRERTIARIEGNDELGSPYFVAVRPYFRPGVKLVSRSCPKDG